MDKMLHRIHKIPFRSAEDDNCQEQGDEHEDGAIKQSAPIQGTTAHAAVLEGFENGGKGIHGNDVAVFFRCGTQGVDDRSGVHEELHAEADQLGEVAVFGGHGGDDESPRHGVECDQEDQEREQEQGSVDGEVGTGTIVVDVHGDEKDQLDAELDEVGGQPCQRYDQTGEVDFPEDAGIGGEDVAGDGKCGVEVVPEHDTGHVEEGLGGAIGGDACQAAEHEHVHYGGEDGLDEEPQRSKDGLLVYGHDIALHVHVVEVAIAPDAFEVDVQESFLGLDFNGPIFFHVSN